MRKIVLKTLPLQLLIAFGTPALHAQSIVSNGYNRLDNTVIPNGEIGPVYAPDGQIFVGSNGNAGSIVIDGGSFLLGPTHAIGIGTSLSTGTFTVTNGGKVTASNFTAGDTSINSSTIFEKGSQLDVSRALYVGRWASQGRDELVFTDAGTEARVVDFFVIGTGPGATNAYATIQNNARVTVGTTVGVAANTSTKGSLTIQSGGTLEVNSSVGFGSGTQGSIQVLSGGSVRSSTLNIGTSMLAGSSNTVTISGDNSLWVTQADVSLGAQTSSGGTALLTIDDGGRLQTNQVNMNNGGAGTYTLSLNGNTSRRGTLETFKIVGLNSPNVILDFNGGVIQARGHEADLIAGFGNVTLNTGGLYVDTNGFDIGVKTDFGASAGGITKLGTGKLTMSGNSAFNGDFNVNAGMLQSTSNTGLGAGVVNVGGAGQYAELRTLSGVVLANTVNVRQQGILSGVGTVGSSSIGNGGMISPGSSVTDIGTLTVNGNLDFNGGGEYHAVLDTRHHTNDLIKVTGDADLSQGVLVHTGVGDTYERGTWYTVLEAGNLNNTKFASVSSDTYEFLTVVDNYDVLNTVRLGLQRKPNYNFSDAALTPNQKAVAEALQTMNQNGKLDEYVETIPRGQAPAAFDALSGEVHATLRSSLWRWGNTVAQNSMDQLHARMTTPKQSCLGADPAQQQLAVSNMQCKEFPAWVRVVGNWAQIQTDDNAAASTTSNVGLLLGTERQLSNSGWYVGGSFGYGYTDLNINDRRSSATINNYSVALYTGKSTPMASGSLNFMGGVAYTYHDISTKRSIPRVHQNLAASYSGQTVQAFAELGYQLAKMQNWTIEPFIGLNVSQQNIGSFRESGGFAGLNANSSNVTYTNSILGVRAQSEFEMAGKPAVFRGTLGWKQILGNRDVTRTMMANQGSPNFTIAGVPLASATAVVGLQMQVALSRNASFELGFSGEFGNKVSEQTVQAQLNWLF